MLKNPGSGACAMYRAGAGAGGSATRGPVRDMWVDAHLHLDALEFDADRDAVLARAAAAGVGLMISAGTSVDGSRRTLTLADRYPNVRAAVGIHPASAAGAGALAALVELIRHPRVVAIGEVGLDYVRSSVPREIQAEAFRAQVRLARREGLAVVVHNREAHADVERILREEEASPVVCHCFTGTPETALRWAEAGWMISLAGSLTFASAGSLRDVARCVPADRLLVETDAPYLAPVPVRGRRCEPAFLVHTARALGALRGMSDTALESVLEENARRTFLLDRTGGAGG